LANRAFHSRHCRRRGFIFVLAGLRPVVRDEPGVGVRARCPNCHQMAWIQGKIGRQWLTLFLIPLFPIGRAKRFSECTHCQSPFPMPPEELIKRFAASDAQQMQQAITLYNSLRHSPANAITLNELMTLYGSLKEYDSAIAAANEFSQALHASEQCMVTLGRVYLDRGDFSSALQWFDAALGRNPQLGEAHFFKAVALKRQVPPDEAGAQAAVRAARNAGYPIPDDFSA
jgi:tetratricopeptide (TPR) repeat protein